MQRGETMKGTFMVVTQISTKVCTLLGITGRSALDFAPSLLAKTRISDLNEISTPQYKSRA